MPSRSRRRNTDRWLPRAAASALGALAIASVAGCADLRAAGGHRDAAAAAVDHAAPVHDAPVASRADGRIRIEGRRFVRPDGSPFVAIGENRINVYDRYWNWSGMTAAEYVRYMAGHGMTVLRVFVVSDVEDEERGTANRGVLEPELGRFDEAVAQEFDAIFRAAERHGVHVVLVAFALGFSDDDDWKSWRDNPYSRERGGPAATRYEFFESPAARARAAERIRYLARRYAASPNLLAIDLLNEPEWDGAIPEVSWTAWAREMARAWDEADPHDRPVTVGSVGLHWNVEGDEREWWASEACDVVQWHLYGREYYDVHALAAEMTRKVRETWHYGKPILVGEFAYGGEAKPGYDHTLVGLWSATFAGAAVLAHSAPPFNLDSDGYMTPERARHFRVLRDFLEPLPAMAPVDVRASPGVRAWALAGADAAAAWLLGGKEAYGRRVEGARISLPLPPGEWRVQWVDDATGAVLQSTTALATDRPTELTAPPFERHVAVRLVRE